MTRSTSDRVRSEARKSTFSIRDCLQRAEDTFAFPPAKAHIERPEAHGVLVATFVLPLELCPTSNATRHGKPWALAALKQKCFRYMRQQLVADGWDGQCPPLPGRPQVLCTRFSTRPPDAYNDGFKIAVDKLCVGKDRLGIIVDDRPDCADVRQWWELAPKLSGPGFGLVRVFSGRVSVI